MLKIFIILLEIIEKSDFACPYVPSHVIIIIRGSMETYFTEGHPIGRVILSNQQKSSSAISLPIVLQLHTVLSVHQQLVYRGMFVWTRLCLRTTVINSIMRLRFDELLSATAAYAIRPMQFPNTFQANTQLQNRKE